MRTMRPRAGASLVRTVWILLLPGCLLSPAGCRFETGEEENLDESIEAMFRRSAAAWNAGELDLFMESFTDGASTSLLTPYGPIYGREAIRAGYAPLFAPGASRDSLRFEDVNVRPLPPLIGIVTGRYALQRGETTTATGWFTTVVRRAGEGWRIVHDHSSYIPAREAVNELEIRTRAPEADAGPN